MTDLTPSFSVFLILFFVGLALSASMHHFDLSLDTQPFQKLPASSKSSHSGSLNERWTGCWMHIRIRTLQLFLKQFVAFSHCWMDCEQRVMDSCVHIQYMMQNPVCIVWKVVVCVCVTCFMKYLMSLCIWRGSYFSLSSVWVMWGQSVANGNCSWVTWHIVYEVQQCDLSHPLSSCLQVQRETPLQMQYFPTEGILDKSYYPYYGKKLHVSTMQLDHSHIWHIYRHITQKK